MGLFGLWIHRRHKRLDGDLSLLVATAALFADAIREELRLESSWVEKLVDQQLSWIEKLAHQLLLSCCWLWNFSVAVITEPAFSYGAAERLQWTTFSNFMRCSAWKNQRTESM